MSILEAVAVQARRLPASTTKVRLGRGLTAVAAALGANPVCTTTLSDGSAMCLDSRSRTEAGAFWNGAHEPDYLAVLTGLTTEFGGSVYDVGANVGLVAVPLARRTGASIACFEPVPANVARLRHNLELNGLSATCRVIATALGATAGVARMARESAHGASTGNAVVLVAGEAPPRSAVDEVPLRALDEVVDSEGLSAPDVIKLDIEGAEVGFLLGARRTLATARPLVLGEFHSGLMPHFGTTFLDAVDALPSAYAVLSFVDAATVRRVVPAVGLGDVLLVPEEKLDRLPLAIA